LNFCLTAFPSESATVAGHEFLKVTGLDAHNATDACRLEPIAPATPDAGPAGLEAAGDFLQREPFIRLMSAWA
jgi:hypothetical protein